MGMNVLDQVAAWLDGLDATALRTLLPGVRWHGSGGYGDDDAGELVGRIEDAVGER